MIVQIAIPELTDHPHGFAGHWINAYVGQVKVGDSYQIHALAARYMLSVEKAYNAYRVTRAAVEEFWAESDDLRLGAHHWSVWALEECISSMHIAVRCMDALQHRTDLNAELRELISPMPKFVRNPVASVVRQIRAARALLGWSQQQLADKAIISQNALTRLERGQVDPRVSTLEAVERALTKGGIEFLPVNEKGEGVRLSDPAA